MNDRNRRSQNFIRLRIMTAAVTALLIFIVPLTAAFPTKAGRTYCKTAGVSSEQEVFAVINTVREMTGMSTFSWSEALAEDASVRARESAALFSHTRPDGRAWYTVDLDRMYAENLACNYFEASDLIYAWLKNPAHFRNLTGDFRSIGISCYTTPDGNCYWALEMGY